MTLDITTHRSILIRILKDIYTDMDLAPVLGFKGGTAAYMFYELERFSVDLDFDLLDAGDEDLVFEKIQRILETYGVVADARKKRYTFFFLLVYNDKQQDAYNIKVEVNRRKFGSRYEVKQYLGISMKVMVREDMFSHKLVATVERVGSANRDIFDAWFFLKNNWPLNAKIIENRTGMAEQLFIQKCIDMLEALSDRGILSGVGELLNEKQKAWVKKNLRQETIFLLTLRLQQ